MTKMRLKKICRIESYPNRTVYGNGEDPIDCDWNEVYILDLRYGKKRWFDENCNRIENPLKGYNLKEFYKEVEKAWKDKENLNSIYVEEGKEDEFDIMFEDEDIFPYNTYNGINYYDLYIEV